MKKAKQTETQSIPGFKLHGLQEGILIAFCSAGLYLLIALLTFNPRDPGWSNTGSDQVVANAVGATGAWLADVLLSLFGYMAYLFPVMLGYQAWMAFRERKSAYPFDWVTLGIRVIGFILVILASTALIALQSESTGSHLPFAQGGLLGKTVAEVSLAAFNLLGSRLVLVSILLFGTTIFIDFSWLRLIDSTGRFALTMMTRAFGFLGTRRIRIKQQAQEQLQTKQRKVALERGPEVRQVRPAPPVVAASKKPVESGERVQKENQRSLFDEPVRDNLPALGLLDVPDSSMRKGYSEEALKKLSERLEHKLNDFGVIAQVVAVYPGPVITRFEIQPAAGVKVSRISNLAKDLARSLAVISVRVVEVIPGKSVVGIEIPNEDREIVLLGQVLRSKAYEDSHSVLSLALGHDISGQPVVVDLGKMPHLLVAGTTGAGKSVGINAMLLSLLYKSTPADVRLLMVDPKMLELSVYEGIPHLLTPVITDMKDAANGLRWCVAEMERRYRLMAAMGVRNIAGFNRKVKDAIDIGKPIPDPLFSPDQEFIPGQEIAEAPALEPLPRIVVVIDEFADMIMIVGKKVEELIARIAQKARAAGIHLILATQRPSVDVITGLIKANIPTRIAFQVSSKVDSRTILDQGGAEQLLGHGDMLYLPPGSGLPVRVHGAFVSDEEVHRVVNDWRSHGKPDYIEDLFEDNSRAGVFSGLSEEDGGSEDDALYDEAVRFVTETRRVSISSVQRKLRIGYNRAARMVEAMEAAGVVTEMSSNGTREVLAPPPPIN